MLGVPPQLLQEGTAVCGPVAEAMAIGVLSRSRATVAVSITGVAGPDEDEDGNPVGLVYCGVARNNDTHRHIRLKCKGTPEVIVEEACIEALRLLRSFCFSCSSNLAPSQLPWTRAAPNRSGHHGVAVCFKLERFSP